VLALALLSGCGDSSDSISLGDATNCDELAEAGAPVIVDLAREVLDAIDGQSLAEADESGGIDTVLNRFEADLDTVDDKAEEFECDNDFMDEIGCDDLTGLTGSGEAADDFLETVRSGCA